MELTSQQGSSCWLCWPWHSVPFLNGELLWGLGVRQLHAAPGCLWALAQQFRRNCFVVRADVVCDGCE